MTASRLRVFMAATSYPRSDADWQGIFIRNVATALASVPGITLSLWAPNGPRADGVRYECTKADAQWLAQLADRGGIAHRLRSARIGGPLDALGLLRRLRSAYRGARSDTDVFHVNWLQNALPLLGTSHPAVITVLGTDYQLLDVPGMVRLLRRLLAGRRAVLAPNADWMVPRLRDLFGDLCSVQAVPFGIGAPWYALEHRPASPPRWIVVSRVTDAKMGPLFEWAEPLFAGGARELHLIGPNQGGVEVPGWVRFHGAMSPDQLCGEVFSGATALLSLSRHSEGRPQVMLESLASGLPLVASGIPAHAELVESSGGGVLVDTPGELAQAVETLERATNNADLSSRAREFARREYGTWDDCAARFARLYESIAA